MPHYPPRLDCICLAAAAFCAAFVSAPLTALAEPSSIQAPQATRTKVAYSSDNPVEARLKSLHAALRITAGQESQWLAVADVMRENAKTSGALIEKRAADAKTLTAIDDLRAYMAIAEAHVAGVKHLIPAMESLYDSMPDAQKKNADVVFSHHPMRSPARKSQ